MNKTILMAMSIVLGVAAGILELMPASAIQLNLVQQGGFMPTGWTDLGWKAEGRAGALGTKDYEFAIGPNGAQASLTGQLYRDWTNGEEVDWSLNWNGQIANLIVGSNALSYSLPTLSPNVFNGVYLLTNVDTRSFGETRKVEAGTSIDLLVKTVNGESISNVSSSATGLITPTRNLDEKYFFSSDAIASLTGTAKIGWLNIDPNKINARSRVDFQIVGFDVVETSPNPTAVPEPDNVWDMVALSVAIGVSLLLKQKQQQKTQDKNLK